MRAVGLREASSAVTSQRVPKELSPKRARRAQLVPGLKAPQAFAIVVWALDLHQSTAECHTVGAGTQPRIPAPEAAGMLRSTLAFDCFASS